MAKHGKKYRNAVDKVEERPYQLDEAFSLLKQIAYAKFNETVELSMLLGVAKALKEIKAGKVEFRVDKTAIIHVPVGKISFSADQLEDNASSLINAVRKAKPPAAKGKYVRSIYVSSTMSPSIQIDPAVAEVKAE